VSIRDNKQKVEIEPYHFKSFTISTDQDEDEVLSYNFKNFDEYKEQLKAGLDKQFKLERDNARQTGFTISQIVKDYRGITDHEDQERERAVQIEVQKRLIELEENAQAKGYEEGLKRGQEEIYNNLTKEAESKLMTFTEVVEKVLDNYQNIIINQKEEICQVIKTITKWVIQRELKEDGRYIERLLYRVLEETKERSNLLIKVNKNDFESMPEILKLLEERFGEMENVRIEIDHAMEDFGIILESSNGIVDGTLEQQFSSIDHLFSTLEREE
jgi:flagellar assembly protein FliH